MKPARIRTTAIVPLVSVGLLIFPTFGLAQWSVKRRGPTRLEAS